MIILTVLGYFLAGVLIGSLLFKNSLAKKLINLACAAILLTPSDLIGKGMQGMLLAKIVIVLLGVMGIIFFTHFKAKKASQNPAVNSYDANDPPQGS